jgi:hypothetical protein
MNVKLYKIEKGIKVAAVGMSRKATVPSAAAQTMSKLAKGESFLIRDELAALKAQKVVKDYNGRERAKRDGKAYVARRVGMGLRIWRVR